LTQHKVQDFERSYLDSSTIFLGTITRPYDQVHE